MKKFVPLIIVFIVALCLICLHRTHISSLTSGNSYNDGVGRFEIIFIAILYILFAIFCLSQNNFKTSKFYYGKNELYEKNNKFYCWMMFIVLQTIIVLIAHFLNPYDTSQRAINSVMKVWEIAGYAVTIAYTIWFWINKERGRKIIFTELKQDKISTIIFIVLANVGLLAIFIVHSIMYLKYYFMSEAAIHGVENNEVWISLLCIAIVYYLFCLINKKVMKHADDGTKVDFQNMYKYVDGPTFYIFVVLLGFSIYCQKLGIVHTMQGFFSGAIAFELLLSSIVWAKTETA